MGKEAFCVNVDRVLLEGNSPCYKCVERNAHCHSECEKYLEWQKAHDAVMKERRHVLKIQYEAATRKKSAINQYYRREGRKRN